MKVGKHDTDTCPGPICNGECLGLYPPTFCVQCGPRVAVDEDGCCLMCGADAWGAWGRRVVALIDELRKTVETDDEDGYCAIYAAAVLQLVDESEKEAR